MARSGAQGRGNPPRLIAPVEGVAARAGRRDLGRLGRVYAGAALVSLVPFVDSHGAIEAVARACVRRCSGRSRD
jgi:hypothetical protein